MRDPADARLAPYRDLQRHDRRRAEGTFVVESRRCVLGLLADGTFRVRSICCTPAGLAGLLSALERVAHAPDVLVAEVPILKAVTGFNFHRGCLAIADRGTPLTPAALLALLAHGSGTLLALDDVSDPDNVGAVFRNAAAFGSPGVLLGAAAGDPLYRKAIRVSVGATLRVPFARSPDLAVDLARCGAAGAVRVALSPEGAALDDVLAAMGGAQHVVLVVGAEADGLSPAVRATVDHLAAIPMAPAADSLNVGTATGIALHRLRERG